MVGPLRIRLGVILAINAVFTLFSAAASTNETAAGRTPADSTNEYAINEDTALNFVWDVSYLIEFRKLHPDATLVLTVTGTPAGEDGRWCIKAIADEVTHYSTVDVPYTVGVYYVDATTGTITTFDPVTGEELTVDNP